MMSVDGTVIACRGDAVAVNMSPDFLASFCDPLGGRLERNCVEGSPPTITPTEWRLCQTVNDQGPVS